MKNYLFILIIFLSFSCTKDDSLDPRPDKVVGQFVTLQIINSKIDSNNLSTSSFEGTIDVPAKNVDKYELFVAKRDGFGFVSDFVLLETVTSFPFNLKVSNARVQSVGIVSLERGDELRFYGKSYKDGIVADFNSLGGVLRTSQAQKQAYKFYTEVSNTPEDPLPNQYKW